MGRLFLLSLILLAFLLRLWLLDSKGLSYDEAATALMARATAAEIIDFHWRAAFEHPPIWQLFMHGWSRYVGQHEFALRFPSVLAGTATLPLIWLFTRRVTRSARAALSAAVLTLAAPILIYYSQDARMYAIVVALALGSLLLTQQLAVRPTTGRSFLYLLINWLMVGFHYYSVLLVVAEGLFLLIRLLWQRSPWRDWLAYGLTLSLTIAPLLLWMGFAPGFRATATGVFNNVDTQATVLAFFDTFWRDTTFAAIRWESEQSRWGYVLLPFLVWGSIILLMPQRNGPASQRGLGLLPLLALLVPLGLTLLISRDLATRYLLYLVPLLLLIIAVGITSLGRLHRSLSVLALGIALVPAGLALPHYFGPYQKSAYRDMATYLRANRQPTEAILLEGPRQHLLAQYYLPAEKTFLTAPIVELPPYWPVNARPVVPEEMDDYLLTSLREHSGLWLILTAEDEVDDGEFVAKFLTAVAFQPDCQAWLDVRLCHFVSPHFVQPQAKTTIATRFGNDFDLQDVSLGLRGSQGNESAYLLLTLTWQAVTKPALDYRVTVRLLDAAGNVLSQQDAFPIGPLLPPSTWNAGDRKPGYMALPLPANLLGSYQVVLNLYDPISLAPIAHTRLGESPTDAMLSVANVTISDTITVITQSNN
ncbi:MAG: glycosyltransferase family 39 protein [Caldilineaceae bacterium]|nr:glycosyltransferase family 39 protein [Caldilineaceae bacterium]